MPTLSKAAGLTRSKRGPYSPRLKKEKESNGPLPLPKFPPSLSLYQIKRQVVVGLVFVCPSGGVSSSIHLVKRSEPLRLQTDRAALFLGDRDLTSQLLPVDIRQATSEGPQLRDNAGQIAGLLRRPFRLSLRRCRHRHQSIYDTGNFRNGWPLSEDTSTLFLQIPVDHSCYKWPFKPTSPPYKLRQDIVAAGKNLL